MRGSPARHVAIGGKPGVRPGLRLDLFTQHAAGETGDEFTS